MQNPFQKHYCMHLQILISKTVFSGFGGLWEDAEENFAISAGVAEALAKFFTRPQPQTHTHNVFEMPLKHKKALVLKFTNQNNT